MIVVPIVIVIPGGEMDLFLMNILRQVQVYVTHIYHIIENSC
jgi:hypothetical protein